MQPIQNVAEFEKRLTTYTRATKTAMEAARDLANFSITHFKEHGDLGPAQRFHDAMEKNYSRQPAFVKWLAFHAPIVMEKGKFLKDKSDNARDFDIEGALRGAFWMFSPETSIVNYTCEDIRRELLKVITRFETSKKFNATDNNVVVELERYKQFIGTEEKTESLDQPDESKAA